MSVKFQGYPEAEGGVCAARGFQASGIHCGLRKNRQKPDLALIAAGHPCQAAAVYTQNKVKGAPLAVTRSHIADGYARAVIVNSGNANTCNLDGEQKAEAMCELIARELGIEPAEVAVASTGVIGQVLPIEPIAAACPALAGALSVGGHADAAQAIMTTDTHAKEYAVRFPVGEHTVTIGGMAKGSGMIHPNMATMLCFLTTDAVIDGGLLQQALSSVTRDTFNMVSVDGDTSTNDMCLILASGEAGNAPIRNPESEEFQSFLNGLYAVMMNLSRMIAGDGEGATKLLECTVLGAKDEENARIAAKSVITSSLFKAAMFGEDANWGRILCAIGYSGADVDVDGIEVTLASSEGEICVCREGRGVDFSEEEAARILHAGEIKIILQLSDGDASAVAWGCDLTYDYVKINGDYRT